MRLSGILAWMRAIVIGKAVDEIVEWRRQTGHDKLDEIWDGVIHMLPFPTATHQRMERELERVLLPIGEALGLETFHNGTGLFQPNTDSNVRGPDLCLVKPEHVSERGIEGKASLVVEILSPDDESRDKMPFYAKCGVGELWLVDPETRAHEVYVLRGKSYFAVADVDGVTRSPLLGVELSIADGPKLRVRWHAGVAEI
jgi:Uma2 family endonuclease